MKKEMLINNLDLPFDHTSAVTAGNGYWEHGEGKMERETAIRELVHRECARLAVSPALAEQAGEIALAAYRQGSSAFRAIRHGVEGIAGARRPSRRLRLVVDNVSHAA